MAALNSMCERVEGCGASSLVISWLKQGLKANDPHECTLAYFYHPIFSSREHGNQPQVRPI